MSKAILIKTSGEVVEISPKKGKTFELAELQAYVGGSIEMVHTKDGRHLIANEEGKIKDLPYNERATEMYQYGGYDLLVGDVVVCDLDMVK